LVRFGYIGYQNTMDTSCTIIFEEMKRNVIPYIVGKYTDLYANGESI
jgi:hypothetical protein